MQLLLIPILLGSMMTTSYRSVPSQTDDSPFVTSIGERVSPRGCAVSQDMLKKNGGTLDYGDLLYIEGIGYRFVNDTMNIRHKRSIDIWVATHAEEKKFKIGRRRVFLIESVVK